ncbi:hypothetical protein [Streptomyces sp. NPDC000878]
MDNPRLIDFVYYGGHGALAHDSGKFHESFVTIGGGKTEASLLAALRCAGTKDSLDRIRDEQFAVGIARRLLSTVEEDTGLSSITTQSIGSSEPWAGPLFTFAMEALEEVAETIHLLWLLAVSLLAEHLGSNDYEFCSHPPLHESSPLGVRGMGSPRRPRAPGGLEVVPDHLCWSAPAA